MLPNLLHYDESVVVLDFKMENFAYTSKFRQAHGHLVYLFNPFGADGPTHRWNPLDSVDRDPNRRVGEIDRAGKRCLFGRIQAHGFIALGDCDRLKNL